MKFEMPSNCGNSPRMQTVADFARAWGEADTEFFGEWLSGEPSWAVAPGESGTSDVMTNLRGDLAELQILDVVTHGKFGSVDGVAMTEDGERICFAHFLRFTSAAKSGKIAEIRSYLVLDSGRQ